MQTENRSNRPFIPDDGHPCEAALEFRRTAICSGLTEELSADAIAFATSIAWIGKAISRTTDMHRWLSAGVDTNTWQFVRVIASDYHLVWIAVDTALNSPGKYGMSDELDQIRKSKGFISARDEVKQALSRNPSQCVVELTRLARLLPGRIPNDMELQRRECHVVDFKFEKERREAVSS